jgi:predicted molibdopterin-dependent oxidoreductase YjgC
MGIGGMKNDKGMRSALLFGDSLGVRADFVAVSQTFLSGAARLADVVLPAACFAEKRGTFTNVEGTRQVMKKVVDPPGDAKPDLWIVRELAKKMGLKLTKAESRESPRGGKSKRNFQRVDVSLKVSKRDKRHPFMVITEPRIFNAEYELMSDAIGAIEGRPSSYIEINSADARDLKVEDGMRVRINTVEGTVERTAILSELVPRGVVFIPDYKLCAASMRRS